MSYAQVRDGIGGPQVIWLTQVGAPSGALEDGTTWEGPDGRIYTAHGNIISVPPTTGGGALKPDLVIHRADTPVRDMFSGDVIEYRYKG
jgi:hypothetical protein